MQPGYQFPRRCRRCGNSFLPQSSPSAVVCGYCAQVMWAEQERRRQMEAYRERQRKDELGNTIRSYSYKGNQGIFRMRSYGTKRRGRR